MTQRMLIDAAHEEETRVVVMDGNRVLNYDAETANKRPLKGNIYLAKVTRVEPSLQAAFVEYGGNRHGFLAFNEIHPDYYKIPIADRAQLIAEEAEADSDEDNENGEPVETVGDDDLELIEIQRKSLQRRYKIQEVIKKRQILLVQVVKEERGTKGAALTTYLSLPGRYCVLMPNTSRGGGISRKITNVRDRKRLKTIIDGLGLADGMAVILRTAGSERSKAEVKRDYDYLLRLWNNIRELTLAATAPDLIYEEGNLIKRSIRDLYAKEIIEILVDGEAGYKTAKEFMKTLIPSHAKKVQKYAGDGVPLFQEYKAEALLESIHNPTVQLRSGGYIVIHQTEALVAIDVNSGRATRERHIEETALKTNCEAAEEIAHQLRLRDLAGLIVIDFIDMDENRNNIAVERRFKDALRNDRARIQIGRISPFGLLEMSRQRLRPSLIEITADPCRHCGGTGFMQSTDWVALQVLRAIEETALREGATDIELCVSSEVALYLLNLKRHALSELEKRNNLVVVIRTNGEIQGGTWEIEVVNKPKSESAKTSAKLTQTTDEEHAEEIKGRRRRGRRRKVRPEDKSKEVEVAIEPDNRLEVSEGDNNDENHPTRRKRRRGRRGGKKRTRNTEEVKNIIEIAGEENGMQNAVPDIAHFDPKVPNTSKENTAEPRKKDTLAGESEKESNQRNQRRKRPANRNVTANTNNDSEGTEAKAEIQDNTNKDVEPELIEETIPPVSTTESSHPNSAKQKAGANTSEAADETIPTEPPRRGWWQRVLS